MTGVKLPNLLGRGERLQVCLDNELDHVMILPTQGGLHIWHKEVKQLQPQPAKATARETKELPHREHLSGSVTIICADMF